MEGQIGNGVWMQVELPNGKTVLGTKTLFMRKIGNDGQVGKYKCRFVTQGFRQNKGLNYHESFSPTSTVTSMRAVFANAAVEDWELRHTDVKQAYLQIDIDEEVYIELPENYRAFSNTVDLLRKDMDWCNQDCARIRHSPTATKRRDSNSPTQIPVNSIRRFVDVEVESVIVVYVDGILLESKSKKDEERTLSDLRSCFKMKYLEKLNST